MITEVEMVFQRKTILLLAMMACHDSPQTPTGPSSDPGQASESTALQSSNCATEARAVTAFLGKIDRDTSVSLDGSTPVLRADLAPNAAVLGQSPIVYVLVNGLKFNEAALDRAALETQLADAHTTLQEYFAGPRVSQVEPTDPSALILIADERARWPLVVDAVRAAGRAGFNHLKLVFRRTPSTQPPPRTHVDADLEKLRDDTAADDKVSALSAYTRELIAPCAPLIELMGNASVGSAAADTLISGAGDALIKCNCAVAPRDLQSLFWWVMGNPHPVAVVEVAIDPKGDILAARSSATWAEVGVKLSPDAKRIWPTVTP